MRKTTIRPLSTQEEFEVLLRAAEANAFDGCFERVREGFWKREPANAPWRLSKESGPFSVALAAALIGRPANGAATLHAYLGDVRLANEVWDAAYRARQRNLEDDGVEK